jgi:hypothetical protein
VSRNDRETVVESQDLRGMGKKRIDLWSVLFLGYVSLRLGFP